MPAVEDVPLPTDDMVFLGMRPGDFLPADFDPSAGASSLLAQMITLNRILLKINNLNSQTAIFPLDPLDLEAQVAGLTSKQNMSPEFSHL